MDVDTLELDPRLRHAAGFLGQTPLMLIDGELVPAVSGKTFAVYNPATGAVIANVPEADKKDVDIAVAAARRAFPDARVEPIGTSARVGGSQSCEVEAMEGYAVLRAAALAGVPAVDLPLRAA